MGINELCYMVFHNHPQTSLTYPQFSRSWTRMNQSKDFGYPQYPHDLLLLLPISIVKFNNYP
jgi:hypothetical protein